MSLVVCEVCKVSLSPDSYQAHMVGKRHKLQEERAAQAKNLEETGLYIQGVPPGISAADLQMVFGRFGCVSKIEIYGHKAYLNYSEKTSCDEAIKHQHVIHNQVLNVQRRIIPKESHRSPEGNQRKRAFDQSQLKGPSQATQAPKMEAVMRIEEVAILRALSSPAPITEQMIKLKKCLLAESGHCSNVVQNICNDLVQALRSAFRVCELLAFGSMTTGLAFRDSDLDVFAHLEFDTSTHLLSGESTSMKKSFAKAKKCLYSRDKVFSNIVPIQNTRIPILKFVHKRTQVSCDLSFKEPIGYCNSRLLRHYLNMNERFFDLLFFIKVWARMHNLCASNKLSNFSLSMLGLSFLLSLKEADGNKIVPPVQALLNGADPSNPHHIVSGWRCGFNETPVAVALPDSSDFSFLGLLKNFFQYITNLPFNTHVISVLAGELISKETFLKNPSDLPEVYEPYRRHIAENPSNVLCKEEHSAVIHDPFKLNHNLMGRVTSAVLQDFIQACKVSGEKCIAAMRSDEEQSRLFQSLLTPTSSRAKSAGKSTSIILRKPNFTEGSSFKDIMDLIRSIFEKILLLKVCAPEGTDNAKAKVQKTEDMADIHESGLLDVICCEGKIDVWNGRRKAKSQMISQGSLMLKYPLSFENEEYISGIIASQGAADMPIKFKCEVYCKDTKLYLDLYDLATKKCGNFNSFTSFLNQQLSKWVSIFSSVTSAPSKSQGTSSAEQV